MLRKIYNDESGFVVSSELILIATILVLGLIVGQATLRDQVVTELADAADAISALDNSYSYSSVSVVQGGTTIASIAGTSFTDVGDFCDTGVNGDSGQQGLASDQGTCILIDGGVATAGVQSAAGTDSSN